MPTLFTRTCLAVILLFALIGCSSAPPAPDVARTPSVDRSARTALEGEPLLIDTDSAVFWDDGAALAMLLSRPEFSIEGISLVLGNHWPHQGAEYIGRVLKTADRTDIPMYIGAEQPLKNSKAQLLRLEELAKQKGLVGADGFWKGAYSRAKEVHSLSEVDPVKGETLSGVQPQAKDAVTFLTETLRSSPRPITVVALGPLTNLAKVLQADPSLARKIKRLLFMGGALHTKGNTTPAAELNVLFDPEAANVVLGSAIPEKLMFPLDLSNQISIDAEKFAALVANETPMKRLLRLDRGPKFADPKYSVQAWDTLVAAYLIDTSYVTESEDLYLTVEERFGEDYGRVRIVKKAPIKGATRVKVMTGMNAEKLFSILSKGL